MATHATNIDLPRAQIQGGIRAALARWADAFMQVMEAHAARMPYAKAIRELEAKNDAELAKLGLTRDGIPRYVLESMYNI